MNARARARAFFARPHDSYASLDAPNARRFGGLSVCASAVIALALLPFAPPQHLGSVGWPLVIALAFSALAVGGALLRWPERVSNDVLLAISYVAVAQIAFLVWLTANNSGDSPYEQIFWASLVYTAATHPPRRFVPYFVFLMLGAGAPLVYEDASQAAVADWAVRVLLWGMLAVLVMMRTSSLRGMLVGLEREGRRARELAFVDPLTQLGNRRAFDDALRDELARGRRTGSSFALVVADLDHLKQINDNYGHPHGDRCLRTVADVLRETLRASDSAFRWGGDEFVVLLVDTDDEAARLFCRRLDRRLASAGVEGQEEPLTLSWGVAAWQPEMTDEDLIAAADSDLLALKTIRH